MAKVKLRQLESDLEGLVSFSNPDVRLEQYQTPPRFSAEVLHHIDMAQGLHNKAVLDLGCGCGILGFGCVRLSASRVVGVDIDESALSIATENRSDLGLDCSTMSFIHKDVLELTKDDFPGITSFDMVVMNPPFGTKQQANIDSKFVVKGLEFAREVYSIHKSSTRSHWASAIKLWNEQHDWNIKVEVCLLDQAFKLPRTHKFHKYHEQEILVDLIHFYHQQ